ncbi:hypothetical protein IW261DRAFT_1586815, partial [Armillaria novae-zelandiae]
MGRSSALLAQLPSFQKAVRVTHISLSTCSFRDLRPPDRVVEALTLNNPMSQQITRNASTPRIYYTLGASQVLLPAQSLHFHGNHWGILYPRVPASVPPSRVQLQFLLLLLRLPVK